MAVEEIPLGPDVSSPPATDVYEAAETRVDTEEGARARRVLDRLEEAYGPLYCFLDAETPFQILVAVILSAQSTDETVNAVTPGLFEHYPTPEALADADREHLEELVYSTGFYRNKADYIQRTARRIVEDHGGEVPRGLASLLELPGVARKTGTAVLWYAFGRIEGVTVDTHVLRLSERLGFSDAGSPEAVERDWLELVPQERWPWVTYLLISHGRAVCPARSPACGDCVVSEDCPSAFTFDGE